MQVNKRGSQREPRTPWFCSSGGLTVSGLPALAGEDFSDPAEEGRLELLDLIEGIGARRGTPAHLRHQVLGQLELRGVIQGALGVHRSFLVGRKRLWKFWRHP